MTGEGAAYGSFPTIVQLLAERKADIDKWKLQNKHGWTPLFIAEGYRPGNFKPAQTTIEAIERLMLLADVPLDDPRPPKINEVYQRVVKPKQATNHKP